MQKTGSLKDLMRELRQKSNLDWSAMADDPNLGLPRQFIYDLRDGKSRKANVDGRRVGAADDPRYQKLDAYGRRHGVEGLLEAAVAAQGADENAASALDAWRRQLWMACAGHRGELLAVIRRVYSAIGMGFTAGIDGAARASLAPDDYPGTADLLKMLVQTMPEGVETNLAQDVIQNVLDAYTLLSAQAEALEGDAKDPAAHARSVS